MTEGTERETNFLIFLGPSGLPYSMQKVEDRSARSEDIFVFVEGNGHGADFQPKIYAKETNYYQVQWSVSLIAESDRSE